MNDNTVLFQMKSGSLKHYKVNSQLQGCANTASGTDHTETQCNTVHRCHNVKTVLSSHSVDHLGTFLNVVKKI